MTNSARSMSVNGYWNRSSETAQWMADRLMSFLGQMTSDLGIDSWLINDWEPWEWEGGRTALAKQISEHPYVTDTGCVNESSGYETIVLSGVTDGTRVHFSFDAGSQYIDGNLPIHRFHADPGQLDAAHRDELCKSALDAFVISFDPVIATLSTNEVRRVERKRGWEIRPGYQVWINHLVGDLKENGDAFTVETLGNGRKFILPDDLSPEEVVSAWKSLLFANGIAEVDEYIVQPMEIQLPPEDDPGPIPDNVPVAGASTTERANPVTAEDYRQQITGWPMRSQC